MKGKDVARSVRMLIIEAAASLRMSPFDPKGTSLLGKKCENCGYRVIRSTGTLVDGRFCGPCATGLAAAQDEEAA